MNFKKICGLLTLFSAILLSSCGFNNIKGELYILNKADKLSYCVGDLFSNEGLQVINVNDGTPVYDFETSFHNGEALQEVGEFEVKVTRQEYISTSYNITVIESERKLVISNPGKIEFEVGDYFTLGDLVITDDSSNVITGYTSSYKIGNYLTQIGQMPITISKSGYKSVTYEIDVLPKGELSIDRLPNITTYTQGDVFTSSGLLLKDKKTSQKIDDFSLSLNDGDILKTVGTIEVIIMADGYPNVSFNITVNKGSEKPLGNKTFNFYYLNDLHGSFVRDTDSKSAGLSYIGDYLIKQKNKEPDNSLILSGGDMMQGGAESNLTDGKIIIDAMNEIGFDAMTLGNHEYDWGEDILKDRQKQMEFPLLGCNVFYKDSETIPEYVKPFMIVEKDNCKIGIIGACEKNMNSSILQSISSNLYFPSCTDYVERYSDELRTSYQCDLVICVAHDGGGKATSSMSEFNSVYSPLTSVSRLTNKKYIDAFFFAHDHYNKRGSYNNTPFIEAACNGKYVGELTLNVNFANYQCEVTNYDTKLTYSYSNCLTSNANIENLVTKYEDEIGDLPDKVLCTFKHNYPYSSSDKAFGEIICRAMLYFVNKHTDYFDNISKAYLASYNLGGIRSAVDAGDFTYRDLIKVCPFDNQLAIQTCNESQYNAILNNGSYYKFFEESPIYTKGYTKCVSISYIVEYSRKYQESYIEYEYRTTEVIIEYLTSGEVEKHNL